MNRDLSASCLEVDGAFLYYEVIGDGPLLIPMPGANGTGILYEPLATALSSHFAVALYDRRGFGNSLLGKPGEPNETTHLRAQGDDVARLIQHLSPGKPAAVFASSGSGAMAIELLQSHPGLVRKMILHEPLLVSLLPPSVRADIKRRMIEIILACGASGNAKIRRALIPFMQGKRDQQRLYRHPHFERLSSQPGDQTERDKLVLMKGVDISPELCSRPLISLSKSLGVPLIMTPGGHNGYITDTEEFCQKLIEAASSDKASKL